MIVTPTQLRQGCITSEDIFCSTNSPIMKKDTILTEEHIAILHRFLIPTLKVEPLLADGSKFEPVKQIVDEVATIPNDFTSSYLDAVTSYKNLFLSWQAGVAVEIIAIRKSFEHLLEEAVQSNGSFLRLLTRSKKENYLFHHAVYVGCLSSFLAKKMNYSKAEWLQIGFSGILADAGMAKIRTNLVEKRSSLTTAEYDEMKKHPIYSYNMIKDKKGVSNSIRLAVLQHHERYDGSGYPFGSEASKIHHFSQVVAVADVFHAMSSETYYHGKRSPFDVLEELAIGQFGKFDLNIIHVLTESLIEIGMNVKLTSGEEAEVVFYDPNSPTRPIVKLLRSGEIVHLKQSGARISEVL